MHFALAVYGGLSLLALTVAAIRGKSPIVTDAAWLELPEALGHAASLVGGAFLAFVTVRTSRLFVKHWDWARSLHAGLRPAIRHAGNGTLLLLGVMSGIAEELFFRGLLTPALGLVFASLAFGALHQLRGRVGWIWSCWAGVMGILFGALFLATGSLLGPILAHAAINVTNLRFVRDTDVEAKKPRRLGGLLGRA